MESFLTCRRHLQLEPAGEAPPPTPHLGVAPGETVGGLSGGSTLHRSEKMIRSDPFSDKNEKVISFYLVLNRMQIIKMSDQM